MDLEQRRGIGDSKAANILEISLQRLQGIILVDLAQLGSIPSVVVNRSANVANKLYKRLESFVNIISDFFELRLRSWPKRFVESRVPANNISFRVR